MECRCPVLILVGIILNLQFKISSQFTTWQCACSTGASANRISVNCTINTTPVASISLLKTYLNNQTEFSFIKTNQLEMQQRKYTKRNMRVEKLYIIDCPLYEMKIRGLINSLEVTGTKVIKIRLPKDHRIVNTNTFADLKNVTVLDISQNYLTSLPKNMFYELPNLTSLVLRRNNIQIWKGIFDGAKKLNALELGDNNITNLENGVFKDVPELQNLYLWGNSITNVTREIFSDIPKLEILDLSSNYLNTLPSDLLVDLNQLKTVQFSKNEISRFPENFFILNPLIEEFYAIVMEPLNSIADGILANLTMLRKVVLTNSLLTTIPGDLIRGSINIQEVNLQHNQLKEIPSELFESAKEITAIDLSYNQIEIIPDDLFLKTTKLEELNLSGNKITHISGDLFINLRDLKELNLDDNKITNIHLDAFINTRNLVILKLDNNLLALNDYASPFIRLHNLEQLNLQNNSLSKIHKDWSSSEVLSSLNLANNNFTLIDVADLKTFCHSRSELQIDLSSNKISTIDLSDNDYSDGCRNFGSRIEINLEGNPLLCDCKNYFLLHFLRNNKPSYISKVELIVPPCEYPKSLRNIDLMELSPEDLKCNTEDTPKTKGTCPSECNCFYTINEAHFQEIAGKDKYVLNLEINCESRNISASIPNMTVIIPLFGSEFRDIDNVILNMSGNSISTLPESLDSGYKYITHLDLSFNNISGINIEKLSPNLTVLKLNNNQLHRLTPESMNFVYQSTSLKEITLDENPWICNCSGGDFLSFVWKNTQKIPNLDVIICEDQTYLMSKLEMFNSATYNDQCGESAILHNNEIRSFIIVISVLTLISFIAVILSLYYRYNRQIKIWLYNRQLFIRCVTEDELDHDKIYDAFVSYSHLDQDFVVDQLVPKLENGTPQFKLCLHYRDWVVGEFIPKQIADSVENSRRTIVVLSPNFLESVWGKLEFRTAHLRTLQEKRTRVILILYSDIGPTEDLDLELRAYIAMNTYLKWGDDRFWDRLRFALTHS